MILSDSDIQELINKRDALTVDEGPAIDLKTQLGPSSIDLRLGYYFGVLNTRKIEMVDTKKMEQYQQFMQQERHTPEEGVVIHPGEFILGSTLETVSLPDNLVARVEGRSSYGRLGIVVHASLPYEETILYWTEEDGYAFLPIGEIVTEQKHGYVVGFDPETKTVSHYRTTDFITNPPKDIYQLTTEKGREVHVTANHNVFTLNDDGNIEKIASEEAEGELIAIPRSIPEADKEHPKLDIPLLLKETGHEEDIMVHGTDISSAAEISNEQMERYYQEHSIVPLQDLSEDAMAKQTGMELSVKQSTKTHSPTFQLTPSFAYVAGFFIAEGYHRRGQLVFTNTNQHYIKRVKDYFAQFDVGFYKKTDANGCTYLTVSSTFFSTLFKALGIADKRISGQLLDMPKEGLEHLFQGLINGDASIRDGRIEYYTADKPLASDIMYLCSMIDAAASTTYRQREDGRDEYRIEIRRDPHKLLQRIPVPSSLLKDIREQLELTMEQVATDLGLNSKSSISNLENKEHDSLRRKTLQRIAEYYRNQATGTAVEANAQKLYNLANSDLLFDRVSSVEETGRHEPNYDLEVQPKGESIENFLGGYGGIFLSNTAGYIDPGFTGQITLEMQNLGNAPVKLYPEDRVCQLVIETMTQAAETPYGEKDDSKYMNQTGATGSRLDQEKR